MSFSLAFNGRAGYDTVEEYIAHDIPNKKPPMLLFTRNCEKTWYAMTRLLWDEFRTSQRFSRDPKERVRDKDKDFPDCVRYIVAHRPTQSMASVEPVDINFRTTSL